MNLDPNASIRQAFPGLSEENVRELASAAKLETYHPGFILCHEGRVEDSFYIIVSGHAEVSKQFDDQTRRVLHRLGPGDFFGEIALVQKGPRIATVRTLEMTTALQIDRDSFDAMLERSPRMMLRIVRHVASRLRDADQKAISDLRRKNVELARAYAALEEQQRLRSEFLTTVSHELRTPLAAVTGYLQFLRSGALTSEQQTEMLETVSRNVDRVIHLVNSILFLQELELITPEFHPVDPGKVALEAVQEAREQAAETDVRLQVQIEPDLPVIQGDAMELERAVAVLLDNAIKFSPDGGDVSVEVFAGGNQVGIRVSDPGVGIPTEELENIFEPFTQAPPPEGRLFGGIGIGLPIARHVVELHGGRIEVESAAGQGSTFTIFLPVRRDAPAAA